MSPEAQRIAELEKEVARLSAGIFQSSAESIVQTPPEVKPIFDQAAATLRNYFSRMRIDPAKALIGIDDERYVLVRASAFSIDLVDTLVQLYADRGQREALAIARSFLFDIAFTIGLHDAKMMHEKLGNTDPMSKLSGGPVNFAYTGWSLVNIWPQSQPSPDEHFCLVYDHPYSFEAASFVHAKRHSDGPVCIMNAAYSSGWCKESFGIDLTAIEIKCKARGDDKCVFVMAPPSRIAARVKEHFGASIETLREQGYDVPTYFERKRSEEEVRSSYTKLKEAQEELVRKERLATVGLLVSGVAHEVNTPLGVAITAVSVVADEQGILERKFSEDKLTKKDLRDFMERSGKALAMVTANLDRAAAQIQSFKKLSVDHATHDRRRVDLGAYLGQTLDNLRPLIRKQQLDVSCTTRGDLDVEIAPGVIAQILTNFLMNTAIHARAERQGPLPVNIAVERVGPSSVKLIYSDNGAGMTEEVKRQAFTPFFTTSRATGGSGLGLHIVHSLVADVLCGRIDLQTAPDKGVRFEIEFPI